MLIMHKLWHAPASLTPSSAAHLFFPSVIKVCSFCRPLSEVSSTSLLPAIDILSSMTRYSSSSSFSFLSSSVDSFASLSFVGPSVRRLGCFCRRRLVEGRLREESHILVGFFSLLDERLGHLPNSSRSSTCQFKTAVRRQQVTLFDDKMLQGMRADAHPRRR